MPDASFNSLAVVLAVAFFSRLVLGLAPRSRVPGVVIEIILGIIIGPSVLGWAEADEPVQILALVGLAFLLFLSGLEIELDQLRRRLLRVAALGLGASVVLGLLTGYVLDATGLISNPLLVAVTLVATSLGLVIPVLKAGGFSTTPCGQLVTSAQPGATSPPSCCSRCCSHGTPPAPDRSSSSSACSSSSW